MSNVHGPGDGAAPISHHDKVLYEKEYCRGVDLFQRALDEYGRADEIHKKEAFHEVMDRAMQILNETARELKRSDLVEKNKEIAQAFEGLQSNDTEAARLSQDLKEAKRTV